MFVTASLSSISKIFAWLLKMRYLMVVQEKNIFEKLEVCLFAKVKEQGRFFTKDNCLQMMLVVLIRSFK